MGLIYKVVNVTSPKKKAKSLFNHKMLLLTKKRAFILVCNVVFTPVSFLNLCRISNSHLNVSLLIQRGVLLLLVEVATFTEWLTRRA